MKSSKVVSVIIPVYNVKPFIREALDSVLHQVYQNLEIIIIDDGSTDGSGEICDEYTLCDNRIRVIHQENKGLSSARNKGLEVMTGDFVAFLDPDDAYNPLFIYKMLTALIENHADIAVCNYSVVKTIGCLEKYNESNEEGLKHKLYRYNKVGALHALADNKFDHSVWNKLYRRELWDKLRFPEGHVYEDVEIGYRIVECSKSVCVLEDTLYIHRKRQGSITQTESIKNLYDSMLASLRVESFFNRNTPEIFTKEQLRKKQVSVFSSMLGTYSWMVCKKKEKCRFGIQLKKRVLKRGNDIGISELKIHKKMMYFLISYCPSLLKILYPIYLKIKRLIKNNG